MFLCDLVIIIIIIFLFVFVIFCFLCVFGYNRCDDSESVHQLLQESTYSVNKMNILDDIDDIYIYISKPSGILRSVVGSY